MKEFDADELAGFNGENGNPIYVAYDGKVYDVSESKLWRKGQHMKRHRSGNDLTARHAGRTARKRCAGTISPGRHIEKGGCRGARHSAADRPAHRPVSLSAASSASDDGSFSHCFCLLNDNF